MLASIGLELGVTFLSGVAMKGLRAAPAAGASLLMPWARSLEGWVEEATLRPCGTAVLPLGPRFSERFLLAAAACANVSERTVRGAADRERERIEPLLRVARERVRGARVAVLADTPTAAGLASFLGELDMQVVLLGLLDRTLGGVAAMRELLRESRVETDPGCAVLEDPSAVDVEAAWRPADVLIAPDVWLPEAVSSAVRRVEMGFPSNNRHAIYGAPLLGFRGSVALAQRLLDAVCGVH
jgi:nitrogenase molybdenum-iron protein alpha/beta subunit